MGYEYRFVLVPAETITEQVVKDINLLLVLCGSGGDFPITRERLCRIATKSYLLLVSDEEEKVVAFGTLIPHDGITGSECYIEAVIVDPALGGLGIDTEIVRKMQEGAKIFQLGPVRIETQMRDADDEVFRFCRQFGLDQIEHRRIYTERPEI